MAATRSWAAYRPTYRAEEVKTLAGWISAGVSASVVGLAGAGKSNLLGFVCHRPEALRRHLPPDSDPVALVLVDLNNLPDLKLSTLYRLVLRAFYELRGHFDSTLGPTMVDLYQQHRAERDPFLLQIALRELLLAFQAHRTGVVLVLDRFDRVCEDAGLHLTDALRGLRDSFKDTLCYIVGLRQPIAYLSDPAALGELYEVLDTHLCWVGPMNEADARQLIAEEITSSPAAPTPADVGSLLALTGGYPALLKAACHWWQRTAYKPPNAEWAAALLKEPSITRRLEEICEGLTQEERLALVELSRAPAVREQAGSDATVLRSHAGQHRQALAQLETKGLCRRDENGRRMFGELFARYAAHASGWGGGRIWLDEKTDELYQGQTLLEGLAPLERAVLSFLVRYPRLRHTKTDLILSTWPEELRRQGVTDESLYQVIMGLRKKIEPHPSQPCYIVNWRGKPEGGYQFYPEGRPGRA